MKGIVVTGGTRGIGRGLAEEFLKRGCAVMISGRTQSSLDQALTVLAQQFPAGRIAGQVCDAASYTQVQALWDAAINRFGRVDIWVNNAGVGGERTAFQDQDPQDYAQVVATNLTGLMNGTQVALRGMLVQGYGQIYNMEGFGSNDLMAPGQLVYGATKRAVTYFTTSLAKDLKGQNVQVCHLSPGMVLTDLLLRPAQTQTGKDNTAVFNILGDRVDTVTPYLVEKMLSNTKNGARIAWLTTRKSLWRFLTAPITKRKVIDEIPK